MPKILVTLTAAPAVVLALIMGVSGWARVAAALGALREDRWGAGDFRTLYSAARMVLDGEGSALYDVERLGAYESQLELATGVTIAYLNPPFFAGLLAPLAAFDLLDAFRVWTAAMILALVATSLMLWRLTTAAPTQHRAGLLAAVWLTFAVAFSVEIGQFSMLLVASWTAGFVALRARRDRLVAFALAPLLIKPELLIPLFLVLLRTRRTAAAWLAAVTVVAVAASLVVSGVSALWDYPAFVVWNAGVEEHGSKLAWMFGWNGLLANLTGLDARATVVTIPLMVATVAVVPLAWGPRWPDSDSDLAPRWLLLTAATLLGDPNLFLQDIPLLAPPLLFALAQPSRSRALPVLALVTWIAAAPEYLLNEMGVPALSLCLLAVAVTALWETASATLPRILHRLRPLPTPGTR